MAIRRLPGGNGVRLPMIQALIRVVAPQGKRDEILEVLTCLKGPTEVARGCRSCRLLQDVEDDRVFTYLVQWDTEEAIAEHLRSERFRRLLPYIEMSLEPPEVDFSTIDQIRGIEFLVAAIGPPPGWRESQAAQDR
jgi:quinol monooxygenase YgiN